MTEGEEGLPVPWERSLYEGLSELRVLYADGLQTAAVRLDGDTDTLMVCLNNTGGERCLFRLLCIVNGEIVEMDGHRSIVITVPGETGVYRMVTVPEEMRAEGSQMIICAIPDPFNDMSPAQSQEAWDKRCGTEPMLSQRMVWVE